jgi:hypothetical protein
MSEHIVAVCYILALATMSFAIVAKPMTARIIAWPDLQRRCGLWLAVTVITFLSHNFWLALLVSAAVVAFAARRESNPAAMYCALLFAAPQFDMLIPGMGLVNYLFEVNHPRAMAMVLLVPAALRLAMQPRTPNPRLRVPDTLFLGYFAYVFLVNATADSVTGLMRTAVYFILDQALLYYVITRGVTTRQRLLDVLASFALGLAAIGLIGAFETMRSWLVYESLRTPLGVPPQTIGTYLLRQTEDGGYLRAYASTGHAIALGFMCMIALIWQIALVRQYRPLALGAAVVAMLAAGLVASVSRGPWLACAVGIAIGLAFGPGARQRLLWMAALVPVAVLVVLLHPKGQKIIDLLPFIGTVEAANIDYRTLLIDRAMVVFWQNPVFGSLQFIDNPVLEEMRQGQGIIDIVNSYLGVALAYGAVGLVLFVAPSLYALAASLAASRRFARTDHDSEALGRALAASMLAILLAIGAVSHYFHIPIVHWLVFSICAAYAVHAPLWRTLPAAATTSPWPARSRATAGAVARDRRPA